MKFFVGKRSQGIKDFYSGKWTTSEKQWRFAHLKTLVFLGLALPGTMARRNLISLKNDLIGPRQCKIGETCSHVFMWRC
jgi:hypothetical protein